MQKHGLRKIYWWLAGSYCAALRYANQIAKVIVVKFHCFKIALLRQSRTQAARITVCLVKLRTITILAFSSHIAL